MRKGSRIILCVGAMLLAVVAGAVGGYQYAIREARGVFVAHSIGKIGLCANGLATLARNDADRTARLLDQQLRLALSAAENDVEAVRSFPGQVPNLVGSLDRAQSNAARIGDKSLAGRLAALRARVTAAARGD